MKIVAVEVELVPVPAVDPPFRWRDGLPGSEPDHVGGLLRVRTDDGRTGSHGASGA